MQSSTADRRVPRYDYGPVAPAWLQHYPRLIRAWAWCRAMRWHLQGWRI